MTVKGVLWIGLGSSVLGFLLSLALFEQPQGLEALGPDTDPHLPQTVEAGAQRDVVQRLAKRYKPADTGAAGNVRGAAQWRLRGVVRDGGMAFALIEQNNRVRRYAPGEAIDDDDKIIAVESNGVEVENRQGLRRVALFEH